MPSKTAKSTNGQKIALTGATGFLGGHVLRALVSEGYSVKALTRTPKQSTDTVEWIDGSLTDEASLGKLVAGCNILLHLAGLTKALSRDIFFDINVSGSKTLFKAAQTAGVSHVIHVSSLSAREPRLSHYGASKAGTELLLTARKWTFSWTIVRPPAIYGPGDKEILKLLKATHFGLLPAPGSVKNRFSMIHASDLAAALVVLCDKSNGQAIVEIDDGMAGGYTVKDVAQALPKGDTKTAKAIPVPFPVLGSIGAINGLVARAINRPAMLTLSTAKYLCHPDWTVKEPRRFKHASWSPQFDLKAGLLDTIEWYRKNDLL